ncbi:MAG: preprotein translocase subunit SecG [bacterium]|nr:preprotein translocase subunit SecG [bacterium]
MANQIINIAQIAVSFILVALILIQRRGGGLGSVFGGESNVYQSRRGIEKTVFVLTVTMAGLFLGLAVLNLLL